ncbi:hypothetical protein E2C01_060834 [Portunus trituberculatus]|uniref:Uncharacterized protein n=1 Tax=Portunus trituberculatus TaxID=210409 RepID=A0A5B7H970_PORTR|nr:hypothetical protein [Portunus trituberculatus]
MCEDGASPENRGRGDCEIVEGETATWEEPGDCPQAGPATGETSLPDAKAEQLVSYAQPTTRKPSLEHGRLPDLEEEIHTGADDESVPWQTDLPEKPTLTVLGKQDVPAKRPPWYSGTMHALGSEGSPSARVRILSTVRV